MERQGAAQQAARPAQRTAIEHRGNRRHRWRFPAATSHSFALDMLLSKEKIVQSSGATALPASWCIFSGDGAPVCKRALAILTLVICSTGAFAQNESGSALQGIDRNDLCVTNGNVSVLSGGWLAIDTPSSRAVVRADAKYTADQVAEIHFRYLGPTQTSKPLASGELRRQIGLKLQAEDTCNLIYAMWHIEPDAMVAVSVKRNAGMHTHEQRARRVARARLATAMASAPTIRTAATANVTRTVPRGTIIGKGTGGPPSSDADHF